MRTSGLVLRLTVLTLLIIGNASAIGQKRPDTTNISSTAENYSVSPPNLTNNPVYDIVDPNREGLRPVVFFNSDDRLFGGLNYNWISDNWKPDSAGQSHRIYSHYSINQKAFSVGYLGIVHKVIGPWNLFVDAGYDWVKWMNFYGLGNETLEEPNNREFYRFRRREATLNVSFQRRIGNRTNLVLTPFYQRIHLINDAGRFLSKSLSSQNAVESYKARNFAGLRADWQWQQLNDRLLPTKGVILSAAVSHARNMNEPRSFTNYTAYTRLFVPFLRRFVFSTEYGAAAVTGQPEFYQLNAIGGNRLRGHRGERFWGETIFHNNNELQYIFNVKNKLISGKMGFLAFVDQGRVWKTGERSDTWHYGYGGGIMLVPYQKLYLSVQYGVSKERNQLHLEFRRAL